MTIVIGLDAHQAFYMVGDIMLTSGQKQSSRPYPTEPDKPVYNSPSITGLTQKIIKIGESLYLGWSGDVVAAVRFIQYLKEYAKHSPLSRDSILEHSRNFTRFHKESSRSFSAFIFFYGDGRAGFLGFRCADFKVPSLGYLYATGSGTEFVWRYVNDNPADPPRNGRAPHQNILLAHYLLRLIQNAMHEQHKEGLGVGDGWGGAFEILLSKDMITFEKVDRIMYQSYNWHVAGQTISVQPLGRKYYQFYADDGQLIILSQASGTKLRYHIACHPEAIFEPSQLVPMTLRRPELILTKFVNSENGEVQYEMEYYEGGHGSYGVGPVGNEPFVLKAGENHVQDLLRMRFSIGADPITPRSVRGHFVSGLRQYLFRGHDCLARKSPTLSLRVAEFATQHDAQFLSFYKRSLPT